MGKRTNTILQSAFFALADVMPIDEAIKFMKDAAEKSYMKKGQEVVDMNFRAIEAGATAAVRVDVTDEWVDAGEDVQDIHLEGSPALVKMVRGIMQPVSRMDGDSLPVSAFVDHVDGQFEQGASAFEKRGVAASVPAWNPDTCIQCNQCSFVCPHATIRPFALDEAECAGAPEGMPLLDAKGKTAEGLKYTLAVSQLDCMGCHLCVGTCPTDSLAMVPIDQEVAKQPVFDWCVENVSDKPQLQDATVKGSQFCQPLLEFSGSCAGCAETSYARLVTQLFGDRMYVANATGCSSIWGGPAATSPYTVNRKGHGPAWSNSLFEDNAEHGLGMLLGHEAVRNKLVADTQQLLTGAVSSELADAAKAWLEAKDDGDASVAASEAYVAELREGRRRPVRDRQAGLRDPREPRVPDQEVDLDIRRRRMGLRHRVRRPRPRACVRRGRPTSSCSTPRSTPTPADRRRRRPTSARWRSSPPPGKRHQEEVAV